MEIEMNQHKDKSKTIEGIKCEVTNCVYHAKEHRCDAGKIEVGPGYAHSSDDTICATFTPGQQS